MGQRAEPLPPRRKGAERNQPDRTAGERIENARFSPPAPSPSTHSDERGGTPPTGSRSAPSEHESSGSRGILHHQAPGSPSFQSPPEHAPERKGGLFSGFKKVLDSMKSADDTERVLARINAALEHEKGALFEQKRRLSQLHTASAGSPSLPSANEGREKTFQKPLPHSPAHAVNAQAHAGKEAPVPGRGSVRKESAAASPPRETRIASAEPSLPEEPKKGLFSWLKGQGHASPDSRAAAAAAPASPASPILSPPRGQQQDMAGKNSVKDSAKPALPKAAPIPEKGRGGARKVMESYSFITNKVPILATIYKQEGEFVPRYAISVSTISPTTEIVLEKIRQELIREVNLGIIEITNIKKTGVIEESFKETIEVLIKKHFPDVDTSTAEFLVAYLVQRSLGLGNIEMLMGDKNLEEIAINGAEEPIWVYHRKYGWLKSELHLENEDQIRHYATMIGRRVGRQITVLEPLMDANMSSGDRVNATLAPVSLIGNTLTLRKFASKPWTITDFLEQEALSPEAAALVWLAVQYELSTIISGGTATGKTSMLNVVANFFPPNQRIISIEDTHEIQLPRFQHWVPLLTRLPNAEGKGGIAMIDLLVNSLRMRPDRIIVGEIRRKREAEVLFEAIHTGHSVYATLHANNTRETITRLTNPPIEVPASMLPAISMIIVQYRNRRTGIRRTFQISEVLPNSEANVLMQLDMKTNKILRANKSVSVMDNIGLYTGMSPQEIQNDMKDKQLVLKWMVKQKINTVDTVGRIMAEYYTEEKKILELARKGGSLA